MNIFYVYEHWRLDTNVCFYVGKGTGRRAFRFTKTYNHYYTNVIKKLYAENISVDVRFVGSDLSEVDAFSLERERIAYWRKCGIRIANLTDGGEGLSGPSEETRMKIGLANRGKIRGPRSAEDRAKISAGLIGKKRGPTPDTVKAKISQTTSGRKRGPRTPEHQAKMIAVLTGRFLTEEHKRRISEGCTGKGLSDYQRSRIIESNRTREPMSAEGRARISAANKGAKRGPMTDEHKAKIGAARRSFFAAKKLSDQQ